MPLRQKRVYLRFPTDSQVRYLERVPEPGDRVSGLAGEEFIVSEVRPDGMGFVVVAVEAPSRMRKARK